MNLNHFKEIEGFPEYLISRRGKVWSKRTKKLINTGHNDNIKGYPRVRLCQNGKKYKFFVHRLVAFAFKPNPGRKEQVNHDDFNIRNFDANNLTWMTASENMKYNRKKWTGSRQKYKHKVDPVCGF